MKSFSLSAAFVACGLFLVPVARAATYTETGDAGDLPATAQIISGTGGTALTQINGALTLTNNTSDSDLFKIYISNTTTFSASMVFSRGVNNFDSQLAIFNASGQGVKANDDAANGSPQAAIPAGALTGLPVGTYYLLVSGSGRYAADSGGNLIFPNYNDGTTDPTGTYSPNSSVAVIAGYTGYSDEAGPYAVSLAGSQFVPIPEPACAGLIGGGISLAALWRRSRRVRTETVA